MTNKQNLPIHILLADDDKDDRFFFEKALQQLPLAFKLTMVNDGQYLMEHLAQGFKPLPDMIFLDLNMPRKNGLECLIELKRNEKYKHIPVIIYSTSLRDELTDVFYAKGAHYYLQKCDFNELPRHLNEVIRLVEENPKQPGPDNFLIHLQEV